jgi:acyl carrier protein
MTIQELSNKVRECIAYKLEMPLSKVNEEDDLMVDLGADSLDTVEIIMAIEGEFELEIPDSYADYLHTVGDYVDFVAGKIGVHTDA